MTELAYSFHLGRNKNKRTSARNNAKNNLSGSSSLANNGIQNANNYLKLIIIILENMMKILEVFIL